MKARHFIARILGLAAMILAGALNPAHAATDGVAREEQIMLPMRDGTELFTWIVFPSETLPEGGCPVVLERSPYPLDMLWERTQASRRVYLDEGFVLVIQNVRGFQKSEGTPRPFLDDGWSENQDGVETLAWIAAQPWCNGKIGTVGGSAGGITQFQLAGTGSPLHTCMVPAAASLDNYNQGIYVGGVYRYSNFNLWMSRWAPEHHQRVLAEYTYSDFWHGQNVLTRLDHIRTPGLFLGGWFDQLSRGATDAFVALQDRDDDRGPGQNRLILGPWTHGSIRDADQTGQGALTFPETANFDAEAVVLKWLRYWLKGDKNALDDVPLVQYYVMGATDEPGAPGNYWRLADRWPVPGVETHFYLHKDMALARSAPETSGTWVAYDYDPANPVPSYGGLDGQPTPHAGLGKAVTGPYEQQDLFARDDVLLFQTSPLDAPFEATGLVLVKLWVSSNQKDTDFTAKLMDIYPDGRAILLTDGIFRARFREGFDREVFMEPPPAAYPLTIDLQWTSYIFNTGHRIGLAISSSNFPRFEPNTNDGRPHWSEEEPGVVATNFVHLCSERPSRLLLTEVPAQVDN